MFIGCYSACSQNFRDMWFYGRNKQSLGMSEPMYLKENYVYNFHHSSVKEACTASELLLIFVVLLKTELHGFMLGNTFRIVELCIFLKKHLVWRSVSIDNLRYRNDTGNLRGWQYFLKQNEFFSSSQETWKDTNVFLALVSEWNRNK